MLFAVWKRKSRRLSPTQCWYWVLSSWNKQTMGERVWCHLRWDWDLTHISSISHLFPASCLVNNSRICKICKTVEHVFSKYCPDLPAISAAYGHVEIESRKSNEEEKSFQWGNVQTGFIGYSSTVNFNLLHLFSYSIHTLMKKWSWKRNHFGLSFFFF